MGRGCCGIGSSRRHDVRKCHVLGGHMMTCGCCCGWRGGGEVRGVRGEQWRGGEAEVTSEANGEKAEYCEGLIPLIPTRPPSTPSSILLSQTPFPWIPPLT